MQNAQNPSAQQRIQIGLSDGHNLTKAMLATQLNELVTSNQLQLNSIVQLEDYLVNELQGRK